MYILKKILSLNLMVFFRKYLLIILFLTPTIDIKSESIFIEDKQNLELSTENLDDLNQELLSYRIGPGDKVYININDINYLSGSSLVTPDGYLILPELNLVKVDGLTIKGLKEKLDLKYKAFVKNPNSQIYISSYRPVKFYVHGEVKRPGFYAIQMADSSNENRVIESIIPNLQQESFTNETTPELTKITNSVIFPTVFDAIQSSRGITPYSDLSNVNLIRTIPNKKGEKIKYKAELNFLSMIMEGDQSQNMRILDGDVIFVEKSEIILKDQFNEAGKSNLTPDEINVYVSGNVVDPGQITIPKGSGLNQALAIAGGQKVLSGKVHFLRFNNNGETNKSSFRYSLNARINSKRNPILMDGDIIHINESIFAKSSKVITILTNPILRSYGLYSIFD